jgi:peptidyl-prolyl cis-trans isomerase C
MDYLTSGLSCLICGSILIGFGAFLTSWGWFRLNKSMNVNEWQKKYMGFKSSVDHRVIIVIICLFIAGAMGVGVGGWFTTQGWDLLKSDKQKKALIVGLAREWRLNEFYTHEVPMNSAQDRILTSELLNPSDRKDRELLDVVVSYERTIEFFNTLLAWKNEECAKNTRQEDRKKVYLEVREAPLYIKFNRFHNQLLNLLENEYNWALLAASADPSTDIVTVNGEGITEGQLDSSVKSMLEQRQAMGQQADQAAIDQMRSQALGNLIIEILVRQQLKANKIVVTGQDVEDYIQKMLATVEPPMTLDELKSRIKDSGRTYEQWKEIAGFEKRMQIERLLEISNPVEMKVTDEEAQKYYNDNLKFFQKPEQVRASHILIKVDNSDPNKVEQNKAAAKKKALDILDKIKKGADFAKMATESSDDKASAVKGGDLNYFEKSRMVPQFADAAFSLKVGQVSDPVETTYGFHIIKVVDHRDATTVPLEKAKPGIVDFLKSNKMMPLGEAYLDKIRDEATIVYPSGSAFRAYQTSKTQIKQPAPFDTTLGQQPMPNAGAATPAPKQPAKPTTNQPK